MTTGDADLYVRMNGQPTFDLYDCRPYGDTSNEKCELSGPGPVSISVNGYAAASVSLKIRYGSAAVVDAGVVECPNAVSCNPGGPTCYAPTAAECLNPCL